MYEKVTKEILLVIFGEPGSESYISKKNSMAISAALKNWDRYMNFQL